MQPKTEEFLNLLLWSADLLARPTFRNLTDSYESWAYRNGLLRQITTLERQQLLERDANSPDDRLYRLSAQGRLHVLGGRDPEERWARPWDGHWRLVLFEDAAACRLLGCPADHPSLATGWTVTLDFPELPDGGVPGAGRFDLQDALHPSSGAEGLPVRNGSIKTR